MPKNYYVSGNRKEGFKAKAEGASRAGFVSNKQSEVVTQARAAIRSNGGGELRIQNTHGQFRAADTVPPKPDKFPPRG
jgi:hypothetical protein